MTNDILTAFESIGAEATIETRGFTFEIDVLRHEGREAFKLTCPWSDSILLNVRDVQPKMRHLVLDVTGPRGGARYLCGHDERHWFVASLPFEFRSHRVLGAMESLKPAVVRREQKRKGVTHRRWRRKTAAYVRQGEWFFLPRPMMHVGELAVRNGELSRGGGKPHRAEWLYRPPGGDETFVRGEISHPDHATICLQVWHRVVQNNEAPPEPAARPVARMTYLD